MKRKMKKCAEAQYIDNELQIKLKKSYSDYNKYDKELKKVDDEKEIAKLIDNKFDLEDDIKDFDHKIAKNKVNLNDFCKDDIINNFNFEEVKKSINIEKLNKKINKKPVDITDSYPYLSLYTVLIFWWIIESLISALVYFQVINDVSYSGISMIFNLIWIGIGIILIISFSRRGIEKMEEDKIKKIKEKEKKKERENI